METNGMRKGSEEDKGVELIIMMKICENYRYLK